MYRIMNEKEREEDHRPWGYYIVYADEPDHKVKRIVVNPGARLSFQRHFRRSEHWFILSGEAMVTLNEKDHRLQAGQSVEIPVSTWHRIQNPGTGPLEFIEIQTGTYFGEDDIERGQDDYGRS